MTEAAMDATPAVVERIPTAIVLERVRGAQVTRITAWVARVGICRMTSEGGCYWIVDADNRDRCSRCAGIKSHEWPDGSFSYRVGPKAAGRLLDGKAWDEYPEVRSGE